MIPINQASIKFMRTIWRIKQLRGSHPISIEIIDSATLKICLNSFCFKMEKIIQKASFHDAKIIAFLVSQSNKYIADKFGLTIENNPKHPSFYTKKWYLKLGFIEGK